MRTILMLVLAVGCGGDGFESRAAPTQAGGGAGAGGQAGAAGGPGEGGAGVSSEGGAAGAPGGSAGAAGQAGAPACTDRFLHFTGVEGQYVELPSFDFVPPFTVEAWFKNDGLNGVDVEEHGPENPCGGLLRFSPPAVQASITASYETTTSVSIDESWHHVAWTDDGEIGHVFLDGVHQEEATPSARFPACSGPLTVGVTTLPGSGPIRWGTGFVDELRVSRTVRYTDTFEPAQTFEPDANTFGLWHFDETAGAPIDSATSIPGTLHGNGTTLSVCD